MVSISSSSRALGSAARRGTFEQTTYVERVVNGLHGDASDEISVTNDAVQIPLLPQPGEALADGRPAHPMLAGEADFRKRRTRRVAAADDANLDVLVGALDLG